MRFANRTKLLRIACAIGIGLLVFGFSFLFLSVLTPDAIKLILGFGFALSIISSIALVTLRCPTCKQRFTGSQSPGDEAPSPKLFTKACRYCGHLPS